MRTAIRDSLWIQFVLCAAAATLAAILYLTTPQKPPELSSAEWTMLRAHMLWKGYLIWMLICASVGWFIGGCWRCFIFMVRGGKHHDEA